MDSLLFSLLPGRFVCSLELLLLLLRWLLGDWLRGSAGTRPSFIRFFCFMRRFWNQILTYENSLLSIVSKIVTNFNLTCVSFNWRALAISIRRALVKYLLKWNSFSNSVSCLLVKFVLPVLFPFKRSELTTVAEPAL